MRSYTINENDSGQRLDKFVTKVTTCLPSSLLYKGIRNKRIKVNGKKTDISYKLIIDDIVELYINDEFFEDINENNAFLKITPRIDVIYEDENILLINKPAGMVVHEDENEKLNTVLTHLQAYLYNKGEYNPKMENSFAPALCNRIDRNTSGIVIAAKNAQTLRVINQKIKDREINKYYLCITRGIIKPAEGELHGYLVRDTTEKKVKVYNRPVPDGKSIITKYRTVKNNSTSSLVEVELITGRTHQIRAHFASIGYPLLGDGKYGTVDKEFKYQALSSYKLTFTFTTPSEHLDYLNNKTFQISVDFADKFNK